MYVQSFSKKKKKKNSLVYTRIVNLHKSNERYFDQIHLVKTIMTDQC
jgi:hypothetical protein